MDSFKFKIVIGKDRKFRFTLLFGGFVVTDGNSYDSIVDALEGIKRFKFVIDDTFEILENFDEIQNYEQGL